MNATDILRAVSEESGIGIRDIMAPGRLPHIVRARQLAMLLIREQCGLSFPKTAREVGRSDHTTVIHGCRAMRERLARPAVYPEYRDLHDRVVTRLGALEAAE